MKLLGFGKEKLPSVVKDPFKKTSVTSIYVRVGRPFFSSNDAPFKAWGSVEFENGKTKGEQKFEGDTFDDVVLQIKAMLDNL